MERKDFSGVYQKVSVICALFYVSHSCTFSLEIGEDLCQKRKPYEAIPYLEKAMEDPRNLDAWIARAFLARTLDDATELLMDAESQGVVVCIFRDAQLTK